MYVDKNGGKDILASYKKTNSIDETMRRKLSNIVVAFLTEKFGLFPTKDQKISVALATVNYTVTNSQHGGIVSFFSQSQWH